MVKQAANVINKIGCLPPREQELIAEYLDSHFDEVLDEARWEQLFARSSATLDSLAAEVDQAIAENKVAELDPDEL